MGCIISRLAAPIAEKPNPESPLITPDRNTIASMLTNCRTLNPAMALGVAGHAAMSVTTVKTTAVGRSQSAPLLATVFCFVRPAGTVPRFGTISATMIGTSGCVAIRIFRAFRKSLQRDARARCFRATLDPRHLVHPAWLRQVRIVILRSKLLSLAETVVARRSARGTVV